MWNGLNYKRTRLAPTPSGFLHLGNLASFILTCRLARLTGATIRLRIDDIDHERVRREYLEDIFLSLLFMGLPWDEGPKDAADHLEHFSQLKRKTHYQDALHHLACTGSVFACSCSRTQIKALTEEDAYPGTCLPLHIPLQTSDVAWRLRCESDEPVLIHIAGRQREYLPLPAGKKYVQVMKRDGQPAYQLSSLVDDILFEVDLIVRGADLFDSSLTQHYLSRLLPTNAFQHVHFVHHQLMTGAGGKKLSKSAGATSITALRNAGKTREDVLNIIGEALGAKNRFDRWEALGDWMLSHWI